MKSPFSGLPREVAVLVAVAVAVAIGFGIVAPAIPVFAESFGVGKTAAGAVISAFALMRFVSALAGGRMVDAFGERIILATGIFIVAVSTGLAGLSQNYTQLLVLRGVGGIGSAMFTVSATALLFRVVDSTNRGRATGLFQSGFLIGGLLGPLVGGVLTDYSLRLPFYVYAVSLIAAGSIAAVFLQSAKLRDEVTTHVGAGGELVEEPKTTSLQPGLGASELSRRGGGELRDRLRAVRCPDEPGAAVRHRGDGPATGVDRGRLPLLVDRAGRVPRFRRSIRRPGRPQAGDGRRLADHRCRAGPDHVLDSAAGVSGLRWWCSGPVVPSSGRRPGAVVGDVMEGRGGRVVAVFQMASDFGAITGPLLAGFLADTVTFGAGFGACAHRLAVRRLDVGTDAGDLGAGMSRISLAFGLEK